MIRREVWAAVWNGGGYKSVDHFAPTRRNRSPSDLNAAVGTPDFGAVGTPFYAAVGTPDHSRVEDGYARPTLPLSGSRLLGHAARHR